MTTSRGDPISRALSSGAGESPRAVSRRGLLAIGAAVGTAAAGVSIAEWLPSSGKPSKEVAPGVTLAGSASASASPAPPRVFTPLNRFPRMVQEYFVDRMKQAEELAEKRRAAVDSRAAAEAYVRDVRARIQACFGPSPAKTPLNSRVTGVLQRDGYRIEKVIFDSRPNFPVTANLYVPKGRRFPLPGVVGAAGHAASGKASGSYQAFAQGLVRMGYVVLMFDPISQAERVQLYTPQMRPASGVRSEHSRLGSHLALVGESFAAWYAWDGIRALDYLLSRPEVDPRHVGITGNSGGGTQTTWLAGMDSRWTMAAPSCFVTTFRRNLENELLSDAEQCPPHVVAEGLDQSDFLAAMAPKPVILLGRERDFFDVRGLEESYQRLRRLYQLLGAEDRVSLFVGPGTHGYARDNREAMYGWFNRFTKISSVNKEPEVKLEKEEDLWCTPNGRVNDAKPRTLIALTADRARVLRDKRGALRGLALAQALEVVLQLRPRSGVPNARVLRPLAARKYPLPYFTTYLVETEPGILATVQMLSRLDVFSRPPQGVKHAVLYVAHQSSDVELREEPLIAELIAQNPAASYYACDVRGTGDSYPRVELAGAAPEEFYSSHAMMLDRSYVGQMTHDILVVLDWLKAQGHEHVHLVGKGWGAIPATFAAVLSGLVKQVTLKNSLSSYQEIAESDWGTWPSSLFPFGVLQHFDLPDCYAELAAKGLRQIGLLSINRQPDKSKPI